MNKIEIRSLTSGLLGALSTTLGSLAIIGLYIFISDKTQFYFSGVVLGIIAISLLLGGWLSGYKAKSGGLINGSLTGLVYAGVLLLVQSKMFPELFSIDDVIIQSVVFAFIAAIGGVAGVNTPHMGKRRRGLLAN